MITQKNLFGQQHSSKTYWWNESWCWKLLEQLSTNKSFHYSTGRKLWQQSLLFNVFKNYIMKKKTIPLSNIISATADGAIAIFWGYRSFISHVKQNVKKRWGSLLIILHNKVHLPSKGQVWPDFFHFFLDAKDSVSDTAHLTDLFTKFNKVTCSFKLTVWI